ncbi:hypothetical protein MNBD_GAMMA26-2573 [hydrothermal vent metagenome]|uniref:DUF2062 domain-containing protein n=1 Tax=hydrothermal vent metagenome TaxID=652676 RepID=A0A3B1C4L0_9ZZZZ
MLKKLIKRYTPNKEAILNHKYLQIFGRFLYDPNLWHLNRRSVSGAFAVGLFWAFIPIPFQMVTAAATAIPARVNLPISVAMVWISNPITMPPMFYSTYMVGTWILNEPPQEIEFTLTVDWLLHSIGGVWQPLYLGSLVCATIAAASGYAIMRGYWRWHVARHLDKRRARKDEAN